MRAFVLMFAVAGVVSGTPCVARAADDVPKFDVVQNCKAEAAEATGVGETVTSCINDEKQAREELTARWGQYAQEDKNACKRETSIAGQPSYVELEICLEMANDVRISAKDKR